MFPITVPSAGESITSAVISTWHAADGALVKTGDLLVTVDTDKVSTEITAEASGVLTISAQPGEDVKIGATIGSIAEGTTAPAPAAAGTDKTGGTAPAAAAQPPAEQEEKTVPSASTPAETPTPAAAPAQGAVPFTGEAAGSSPAPVSAPKIDVSVTPAKPAPAAPAVRDQSGRTTRQRMSPLRKKSPPISSTPSRPPLS